MDISKAFDSYCNCFLERLTQPAERGFELVLSHLTPSLSKTKFLTMAHGGPPQSGSVPSLITFLPSHTPTLSTSVSPYTCHIHSLSGRSAAFALSQ